MPIQAQSGLPKFAFRPTRLALSLFPISLVLFSLCAIAQQVATPPPPRAWVTDTVGLLSPEARQRLDARLQDFEKRTGHQLVVWVGDTSGDVPLDEFATRTFESWRLGRKGLDDGLLMLVLARDRKIAIEVGYGLEDRVPDVIASRVIREVMAPKLRAGDADGAIEGGMDAMMAAIGKVEGSSAKEPPGERTVGTGKLILFGFLLLLFLILLATNPSLAISMLYVLMSGRGGMGGGGGGGVFSGGGGRSGGGGARGGW